MPKAGLAVGHIAITLGAVGLSLTTTGTILQYIKHLESVRFP